jgi:DNA-binding NarL/FixJ family response regulator
MKILIADDHPIYREGLGNLLRSYDFTVVGSVRDGVEAVEAALSLAPDVVLMDANMPRMDGIEATRRIKAENPAVKVIILTGIEDDRLLFESIQAGASGFLLKKLDGDSLNRSLHELEEGKNPFSPGVEESLLHEFSRITENDSKAAKRIHLDDRQIKTLEYLARGMTYKEIGAKMGMSERTVKYHIRELKRLCGQDTKERLIQFYLDQYAD